MNRDEYLIVLDTVLATPTQIGAIIGEFQRLGVHDRSERLAISAALLDLGDLGSTCDLVMGQAGMLIRILREARERVDLPEIARTPGSHSEHRNGNAGHDDTRTDSMQSQDRGSTGQRVTFAAAIRDLIAMTAIAFGRGQFGELPTATALRSKVSEVPVPPPMERGS